MKPKLETDAAPLGQIAAAYERLAGPAIPESLESILARISPRPRYLGPEAWLEAFRACAEGEEGEETRKPFQRKPPLH